ncbi:MAG: redoxin domain-containing protein [candidate division Zixibacteria bacterium]|nr:redoxin domain-containing protein [Gammaproteobacteria bacterium]NIX57978.1 redoxin domain-containing protein [candidate division Zixibacteria bacterium]
MVQTPSNMIALKTEAPDFTLPDTVSGKMTSLSELKSDTATVIMFICNHCPFVRHVQHELVRLANDYQPKGISFIAISSNDVEQYPQDSPQRMREVAEELGYPFPYLFDETQQVARAYQAACTPDFYIFDSDLKCVYRGQLDDSRPGNDIPVTGKDVRSALDSVLQGKPVDENQRPSVGCNIKWKQS